MNNWSNWALRAERATADELNRPEDEVMPQKEWTTVHLLRYRADHTTVQLP